MSASASSRSHSRGLSKFRNPLTKQPSRFFDGDSFPKQLQNSSYGKFHKALGDLRSFLPMVAFQLPRVIVLGGKSAGKSSLLENITKCPVFPRSAGLCTKMPVKLQLTQVATEAESMVSITWRGVTTFLESIDDILAEVAGIMDTLKTVVADELTVQICQVDVPTFELVDLPGIQLFPREQEVLTTSLAQKYLREPDTLVLCVVDATIPALDSSIALKMVRAADKLPNTILALTKSDLVRGETEITGRIFDRILRDSVDNSDNNHLEGLAACVAVSNRNHTDQHSLVGNEAEERSIFRAMLEDLPDFYQPDEVKQQLEENMTIRQLIVQLDKLFHSYIVQKWKPAALAYLAPLREEVQEHIGGLGPAVEALSKDGLLETICDMVQYDKDICSVISASTIPVTKSKILVALGNQVSYREWGTLAWAEATLRIEAKVTAAVKEALDPKGDRYLDIVTRAFDSVFAKDTPLKLKRFGTLQSVLVTEVLPSAVAQAKKAAARTVDKMLKQALMQLDYSSVLGDTFQQLDFGIRGCVIKHIIQQVKMQPLRLPEGFVLTEDAAVYHQRLMLLSKLEKLHTATDKISHIEDALSISAVQPLSAASSSQPNQIPDAVEYASAQQHASAPPDASDAPVPSTAAESTADTAPHSGASQNHASAVGNPPAATGTSAEVQSATAESTPQADSSDEIQMHAIPEPQLSLSTSAVQLDSDNINAQFAAALLQSTWQDATVGQQAPASSSSATSSPASTPVPESFPAQAPASAANSPRAAAPAPAGTGPAQTSAAQIMADQESSAAAQARPSSPAPSEASYVHL